MKRFWWRIWGRCPNCGEKLIPCAAGFLDCMGCGYWRFAESGYEHFPEAQS